MFSCFSLQVLSQEEHELAGKSEYDFDHPDAFDYKLLYDTLKRLKAGKSVDIPSYNFNTHRRDKQMVNESLETGCLIFL